MQKQNIPPGPARWPPFGAFFRLRQDPLGYMQGLTATYGDAVSVQLPQRRLYVFNHPDYIRDILVTKDRSFVKGRALQRLQPILGSGLLTSEGSVHLRQRRLIQPIFHRQRLVAYAGAMVECATRTAGSQRWQDGALVDMHAEMMQLTLAVVGQTLFAKDIEGEAREIGNALNILTANFWRMTSPLANIFLHIPTRKNRQLREAASTLDRLVYQMIEERRADGDRGDLLSLLLAARDESSGEGMSNNHVRDETMTLLLAGHETTANALTWTWYLLAQHPEAEAALHAELDDVLGGHTPSLGDLDHLTYTRRVLSESMRLYPPAWTISRLASEDVQIGEFHVPKGTAILVSQWLMHHDARYYADPWRFDPQRWTSEQQAARPKFTYFPFSAGSRVCIGEHFAWMEATLLLATLAQRWQPRLAKDEPVLLRPSITLRPRAGLPMRLSRRGKRPGVAPPVH